MARENLAAGALGRAGEALHRTHGTTADAKRQRIAEALVAVAGTRGFKGTSLAMVLDRAGVERADFDRHFGGVEDCFVQVWDEVAAEYTGRIVDAYTGGETWREGLRALSRETARFLREDRARARFMVVEVLSAGELAEAHREVALRGYTELIDLGRQELDDPDSVSRVVAEATAGAVFGAIFTHVKEGEFDAMYEMAAELMYMAVLPYLGPEAAAEELALARPDPA